MTDVTVTLRMIKDRITAATVKSGREPSEIRLVAVSKTHSATAVRSAHEAGISEFGENYLQEAAGKIQNLGPCGVIWHYIGRVQANKCQAIAGLFDWVQTVDRVKIAQRLSHHRPTTLPPLNVCIQLRSSSDPARPGADPDDVLPLAGAITALPRLRLRGLMCMPPPETEPDATLAHFVNARAIYRELNGAGYKLDTLSMGTTGDLEAAIEAGSTLVRVGTAIFGQRNRD